MSEKVINITDELDQLYSFVRREQVLDYINQHPVLTELLLQAPAKIQPYFPDAPLTLRVFRNMETVGDTHLTIVITTKYEPRETLDRLDALEDDWGDEVLAKSQGELAFNIQFA